MLFSLGFSGDNLLITKRHLQRSLSSQSLGDLCKYWQLNQNNQETENTQMQNNAIQKVALINSKTQKNYAKRKDRMSQVKLPFTTFGQEMECVYSFNHGACKGQNNTMIRLPDVTVWSYQSGDAVSDHQLNCWSSCGAWSSISLFINEIMNELIFWKHKLKTWNKTQKQMNNWEDDHSVVNQSTAKWVASLLSAQANSAS